MTKGVFLHRVDSIYDDRPDEQYQFPASYLSRAQQCVNDWILYLEPVKAGPKGYHAMAKVDRIIADPSRGDHFLALITPRSYLPFEYQVPFSQKGHYPEASVLNDEGRVSGRAQAAVRTIPDADFNRIVDLGLRDEDALLPRIPESDDRPHILGDVRPSFEFDVQRDRTAYWTSRARRDRV